MKKIYILTFILFGLSQVQSQDIHFTMYDFSPLTLNPAMTGGFEGSYRVNAIYRDQDFTVTPGRYTTPNITLDLPVVRGFRKTDWIGLGISLFQDNSSVYNLKNIESSQSLAYHLSLDKDQTSVLSLGIQQTISNRSLDLIEGANLRTENFITSNGAPDLNEESLMNQEANTTNNFAIGATYKTFIDKVSFFRAGITVGNILRPNKSLAQNSTDRRRLKTSIFAMYDTPLTNRLFLTPQLYYQRVGNNQELLAQAKLAYWLDSEKDLFLNAGLGVRVGDAMQLLLGADYKDWKFGLAYDINLNGLRSATRSTGALEIAVGYVGKIYKKPNVKPTKVCPRL